MKCALEQERLAPWTILLSLLSTAKFPPLLMSIFAYANGIAPELFEEEK